MDTIKSVADLHSILGNRVVLLRCRLKTKKPAGPWRNLAIDDMTPDYLAKLRGQNIGVVLGSKSNHLCALDVDDDALVKPFLESNPLLNNTLRTRGARGCVFWLRMIGPYPQGTKRMTTPSGEDCGEFRSNGSYSIIAGIHPDGMPYQVLQRTPPLAIDFQTIKWPPQISPFVTNTPVLPALIQSDRDTELHSNRETEETEVTDAIESGRVFVPSVEAAVELALPNNEHENNAKLFTLARAVKTLEAREGKFTPPKLREVFEQWYRRNLFLRHEQTHDDYMTEFLNAYASAKIPLGEDPIQQAWKLARQKPLPPEAIESFDDEGPRLLVALCRELQMAAGAKEFFLSARTVQRLFLQDGHATAARWLKSLCVLQFIEEVEKGAGVRASRYRYLLPIALL